MNDLLQKLPGWLSDDLRSLVYKHSLKDKVMEFDKSFARKHILEALQELLPRDEMVLRNQAVILPNQSIHSRPAHSEKSISREGVMKQSGGAETVLSSQAIPLAPVIPIVADFLMSPILIYSILTLLLIAIIWFVVRKKIWNSWNRSFWNRAKLKEKVTDTFRLAVYTSGQCWYGTMSKENFNVPSKCPVQISRYIQL